MPQLRRELSGETIPFVSYAADPLRIVCVPRKQHKSLGVIPSYRLLLIGANSGRVMRIIRNRQDAMCGTHFTGLPLGHTYVKTSTETL